MVLVSLACFISVTLTNKRFEQNVLEYSDMPSPNETALISLICEVLVMTVLKSLAFFLFYFLFGTGYSPSFEYLFLMIFLGLPANVTISSICVYWMLVFDHKQLHLRLENSKKDE